MKRFKSHIIFICAPLFLAIGACVEPFEAATQAFENALVVDARLTDEQKQHVVLLSRARPFEEDDSAVEQNAIISISDDKGNTYAFNEIEPGRYVSAEAFRAQQNTSYQLSILTSDQESYSSESISTPEPASIENLYVERETNDQGEEGVGIYLDNKSAANKYFRYEYEETYKVIAPNYDPFEFEVIDYIACDGNFYEVGTKPRTEEVRVCYATKKFLEIMQASTNQLSKNELTRLPIRFIDSKNYIISHRYSILVKQFAQNIDAHSYFKNLNNFSSSESVFTDIQPGFLAGNIASDTDDDSKVLGYFEVASVDEQRVYFNYADLFPNEPLPPYAVNCQTLGSPQLITRGYHCAGYLICDGACESPLIEGILAELIVFAAENDEYPEDFSGAPYLTLPSPCGDCTKLGSNIVPDFWEE